MTCFHHYKPNIGHFIGVKLKEKYVQKGETRDCSTIRVLSSLL